MINKDNGIILHPVFWYDGKLRRLYEIICIKQSEDIIDNFVYGLEW